MPNNELFIKMARCSGKTISIAEYIEDHPELIFTPIKPIRMKDIENFKPKIEPFEPWPKYPPIGAEVNRLEWLKANPYLTSAFPIVMDKEKICFISVDLAEKEE